MFTLQGISNFSGHVNKNKKAGESNSDFSDEVNKNKFADQVISSDRDLMKHSHEDNNLLASKEIPELKKIYLPT